MSRTGRGMKGLAAGCVLTALLLAGGSAYGRQPPPNRLDLRLQAAMETLADRPAGMPLRIPRSARAEGVVAAPDGSGEPWAKVLVRGAAAETAVREAGGVVYTRVDPIISAVIPLQRAAEVASAAGVEYVEASMPMRAVLDVSLEAIRADSVHAAPYGYRGSGVMVAIYDSGVDYAHEDFRTAGGTRIKWMWDQTASGSGPAGFNYNYGVEWDGSQIDAGTPTQEDVTGHGTHVAGIAVGNGRATGGGEPSGRYVGVAPEADILVIKGGDDTYSSTDIVNGAGYAVRKAAAAGVPVVVNLSLGGHSGAHDGTSNYEMALDALTGTGAVIAAASGNEGDNGIHSRTGLSVSSASGSVTVAVPSYSPESGTDNDYLKADIWYDGMAEITVTVTAPGGPTYGPWTTGDGARSSDRNEGEVYVNMPGDAERSNGDHRMLLEIRDGSEGKEPDPGEWTIDWTLASGAAATVDMWIYDTTFGASVVGGGGEYSVSLPGTARKLIAVGSWVTKTSWTSDNGDSYHYPQSNPVGEISLFSGRGPTRDGRLKPDLTAPGQGIMSALSSDMTDPDIRLVDPDGVHRISQGTSQAVPHVSGTAALMLQARPALTHAQVKDLLQNSAVVDGSTGTVPSTTWGYGKLDALAAVQGALAADDAAAPWVTLGILQNSVLSNYLDLVFVPSETLSEQPAVSVDGTAVSPLQEVLTSIGTIYVGDYTLPGPGTYTITATVIDIAGNDSTSTRTFTAALLEEGAAASLASADGGAVVRFGAGSVTRPGYRILRRLEEGEAPAAAVTPGGTESTEGSGPGLAGGLSPAYLAVPRDEPLGGDAVIRIRFDGGELGGLDPQHLAVHRWEAGRWRALPGYVDRRRSTVEAATDRLGLFQLRPSAAAAAPLVDGLLPNYPNPFNGSTQIRFTLARPSHVEIAVLNVRGQRVRTLTDRDWPAGRHAVGWDGRGSGGQRLASGVYLVLMRAEGRTFTRKILLLQ
ncbi:MAG: S8 family serine peptidase [bacterium]